MSREQARRLSWLAARSSAAELLAQICDAEGNKDSADWFEDKVDALDAKRPDPIRFSEANSMYWDLRHEWCRNLGVKGYE